MTIQQRTGGQARMGWGVVIMMLGIGGVMWGAFAARAEAPLSAPTTAHIFEAIQAMYLEEPLEVPDFTLPGVHGEKVTLSKLQGKTVFLNFWATWCPSCRAERASLQALYEKYNDRGFEILAVSIDRGGLETVQKYVSENKFSFLNVHDRTSAVAAEYGVRGVPSTFFLTPQGKVVGGVIGPREWNSDAVHSLVEYLLSQQ